MERYINLDVEKFVNKLLNEDEKELLEGLEVNVCLDPQCKKIYHEVCECKPSSVAQIRAEDEVISKFVNLLYEDEEIKQLV